MNGVPRIAICDDNPADLARMEALLREENGAMTDGLDRSADLILDGYPSGDALIAAVREGAGYEAYFIDVMMEGLSGIETAQKLNQISGRSFDLVFTTNSADFALDAFGVSAVDYLLKPIDAQKLRRALSRCRNLAALPECVTITKNKRSYRIAKQEITFIESYGHTCVFHMGSRELTAYMTMEAALSLVSDNTFVRCHKSYIVSLAHVQSIGGDSLLLRDGASVPIGRAMRKQFHERYDEYLIHRVWEKRRSD